MIQQYNLNHVHMDQGHNILNKLLCGYELTCLLAKHETLIIHACQIALSQAKT